MERRDFIKGSLALAGLTLAGGCGRTQAGRTPRSTGGFCGVKPEEAHRIRLTEINPDEVVVRPPVDVLFVGGGMSNLYCRYRLSQENITNTALLELDSVIGGNAAGYKNATGVAPWGAHYLTIPDAHMTEVQELLRAMGVMTSKPGEPHAFDSLVLCRDPQEMVHFQGRWEFGRYPSFMESALGQEQRQRFEQQMKELQQAIGSDGLPVFRVPISQCSRDPNWIKLDQITFADWLKDNGYDYERLLWLCDYACRDDYGLKADKISAWAGLHYFCARDGGGFTPWDIDLVWPEGLQKIVDYLQDHSLGLTQTETRVHKVERHGSEWRVLAYHQKQKRWESWLSREVVYGLPSFTRPYLLQETLPIKLVYPPWVVANISFCSVPHRLLGGVISWDNIPYGSDSLGFVAADHQIRHQQERHDFIWTWYRPMAEKEPQEAREIMLNKPWSYWRDQVLDDLKALEPMLLNYVEVVDVKLFGHGMVAPTPGYLFSQEKEKLKESLPGLHFCHTDLSGISSLEESLDIGEFTARKILN